MGDLSVQRVQYDIPTAGGTQTLGTAVSALSAAMTINNVNRLSTAGPSASAVSQEGDDLSASVTLTATDTLTYTRVAGSSANTMRMDVEVVEYVGAASGDNEFINRGEYSGTILAAARLLDVAISGVVDIDKCIPIITGIKTNQTVDGGARLTAYVKLTSLTNAQINIGGSAGAVIVDFSVIEFTGTNWSVGHSFSGNVTADSGTLALVEEADGASGGAGFDVGDWATACIFGQHAGDALSDASDEVSDNWPVFYPGAATTDVDWLFDADHASAGQTHFVHVLVHADMDVQRFTDTQSAAGVMNVTISSTLSDITEAFVLVSRITSGTQADYGRGWVTARISSTTNVELWAHRNRDTIETRIQVVDLSGIGAAAVVRRVFVVH